MCSALDAWQARCEETLPTSYNDGADNPLAFRVPEWNAQRFTAASETGMFTFSSRPAFVTLTRHEGEHHDGVNYLTQMAVAVRQQIRERDPFVQVWRYIAGDNVAGTQISFTLEEAAELAHTLLAAIDVAVADVDQAQADCA